MNWRLASPQHWPTWIGLGLLRALEPLPHSWLMRLGGALGAMVRAIPIGLARVARRNMALCFPQQTDDERRDLMRSHFASAGRALFETSLAWWSSNERIMSLTTIEGLEHIERAQTAGRGVLLLSAHFTTLEIGCRALAARLPLNVMFRPSNNKALAAMLTKRRAAQTRRAIPRDDVRTLIKALKDREIVWYAPDQSYRKKGAEMVPFFGVPAATNTATSRIAGMTNAVVMPYFFERLADGKHYRGVIRPPLENFPTDSPFEDSLRFNRLIEAEVRRNPAQFLWIHRRFKGLTPDYPNYYGSRPVEPPQREPVSGA
jgi:KDO2-lipid IV(A) lauroyltransferase